MLPLSSGTGLVCHRAIRDLCKLIGIKDIYVKVEAGVNTRKIAKCFLQAMAKQVTPS